MCLRKGTGSLETGESIISIIAWLLRTSDAQLIILQRRQPTRAATIHGLRNEYFKVLLHQATCVMAPSKRSFANIRSSRLQRCRQRRSLTIPTVTNSAAPLLLLLVPSAASEPSLTLNLSATGPVVERELLGHNLEFTRHDIFSGLSAEILANRKFASLMPCSNSSGDYSCWPAAEQPLGSPPYLAPRWRAIGSAALDEPYWSAHSHLVSADLGHSIRCKASVGTVCGVSQSAVGAGFTSHQSFGSAIALQAGVAYTLRLVLRGSMSAALCIHLRLVDGNNEVWRGRVDLNHTAAWSTHEARVQLNHSVTNASLSITSGGTESTDASGTDASDTGGMGTWWLGSASLTPADAWRGMRRDVIASLKRVGFGGLLRYPGGCYAPFDRWRVGLLDADLRPPIATPAEYCAAVRGGVNAFTDGLLENGVGIDDYVALCEEVGMLPAITLRLVEGNEAELKEAVALIEYVNGDATSTDGGRLRASRGHPAPYGVRYWYLGNEMSQQRRFPEYPKTRASMPPPTADAYAAMLGALVPRLLAASPHTPLRLIISATADAAWNRPWLAAVGPHVHAASLHSGYLNEPARPYSAAAVSACAQRPRGEWIRGVRALHTQLNSPLLSSRGAQRKPPPNATHSIAISADEWGLGPPWRVGNAPWDRNFSVAHAMYAAGLLGASLRASHAVLAATNYFEPINEGAIRVGPWSAALSPVGQAMTLYAKHANMRRLLVPDALGELDVVATTSDGELLVTIAHLNASGWREANLTVRIEAEGKAPPPAFARVTTLRARGFNSSATFAVEAAGPLPVAHGEIRVIVPPFSVVQMALSGK